MTKKISLKQFDVEDVAHTLKQAKEISKDYRKMGYVVRVEKGKKGDVYLYTIYLKRGLKRIF